MLIYVILQLYFNFTQTPWRVNIFEEEQEKQAQVACNIVGDGKGSERIYFYNSGLADARNERIEILNSDSLKGVLINDKWGHAI